MATDLIGDEVLAELTAGIPGVSDDIERAAWLRPECASDTGVRIILRRLALTRRQLREAHTEDYWCGYDAAATMALRALRGELAEAPPSCSDAMRAVVTVAGQQRGALSDAAAVEREACAAMVESLEGGRLRALAARIRARGGTGNG